MLNYSPVIPRIIKWLQNSQHNSLSPIYAYVVISIQYLKDTLLKYPDVALYTERENCCISIQLFFFTTAEAPTLNLFQE